jgi:hypothetical protein
MESIITTMTTITTERAAALAAPFAPAEVDWRPVTGAGQRARGSGRRW